MEQKAIKIFDILRSKHKFVVPIYQRNFAWSDKEIQQLILDVNNNNEESYYLGTLVVSESNSKLYVIDGQQRLTAINLINLFLNKKQDNCNLDFEVRSECNHFLRNPEDLSIQDKTNIKGLRNGLSVIEQFFVKEKICKDVFKVKFYNNTKIFISKLPAGTNLNHYFEIMNKRGEQLEQHEVLKALLMKGLDDEKLHNSFNEVWNACAQMDDFVERLLKGKDFFDKGKLKSLEVSNEGFSIEEIIKSDDIKTDIKEDKEDKKVRYRSILKFPEFLLLVLKIIKKEENVSWDSGNLLDTFGKFKEKNGYSKDFSENFICSLLEYRKLFDKYVIKKELHNNEDEDEGDWNWKIATWDNDDPKLTFADDDKESNYGEKSKMLQSMLFVSSDTNWISADILKEDINVKDMYSYLLKFSREKMTDFSKDKMTDFSKDKMTEVSPLDNGTGVNHFAFNYLDYLLWEKYYEKVRNKEIKCSTNIEDSIEKQIANCKQAFSDFKFSYRSSIEHLWPQSLQKELGSNCIDNFGNLCLVSSRRNSSYRDYRPLAKKQNYNSHRKQSLKQVLMFNLINGENDWNSDVIEKHGKQMKELLVEPCALNVCEILIARGYEIYKKDFSFDRFCIQIKIPGWHNCVWTIEDYEQTLRSGIVKNNECSIEFNHLEAIRNIYKEEPEDEFIGSEWWNGELINMSFWNRINENVELFANDIIREIERVREGTKDCKL